MSNFGIRDFLGLTVTYDSNDKPTYAAYYADAGKTVLINEFNISYSGEHPVYLGEVLRDHKFNIGHGEFELEFSLEASILGVDFNPLASGIVETGGTNQFDIPWTMATGINLGEYIPIGGTAPFTYTVTVDADNKFTTVDEFLQLDNNLNIFIDTSHEVTVQIEDDNGKTFDILLTFTVVSGTFTNTYSFDFLDTTNQAMISSNPGADATTQFSVSVWYKTGTNNRAVGGRWDNATDCHWYFGFDNARPRLWVSGDGSASLGANVQSRRFAGSHTNGVWEHIVFTFNAGTINCYADSVLDNGTTSGTPQASMYSSATQSLELSELAGGNPGNDGIWDGLMDEFSFWGVELTAGEVAELYNSGVPNDLSSHSQSANLLEWYLLGNAATGTGDPEITSGGANELLYVNGMVLADRSTDVPP